MHRFLQWVPPINGGDLALACIQLKDTGKPYSLWINLVEYLIAGASF
jgi:hypothetical protein